MIRKEMRIPARRKSSRAAKTLRFSRTKLKAVSQSLKLGAGLDGVIALPRFNLHVLVLQLDLELPVAAVLTGIGRRVANGVLAAHLLLEFVEHITERMPA